MLDFIKLLTVADFINQGKISSTLPRVRLFKRIKAGDYELSVQASYFHYCTPRETLEDLEGYTEMDLAIFKDNQWVNPKEDKFIKKFPQYNELIEKYIESPYPVGAFIPVNLIQDLYDYLSNSM